jgi:riboflavin synthase
LKFNQILKGYNLGSSICCSGICLTVTSFSKNKFTADISKETLEKNKCKILEERNYPINLENSLKIGDEVSGHFVFGHVDTTGRLLDIIKIWKELVFVNSISRHPLKNILLKRDQSH